MPIRDRRPETRVPQAPRAAALSVGRVADVSGAVALGDAVQQAGAVIENARQATEANDARLRLTEGLGKINRDLAEDTDFATMNDRYDARLSELGKEVFDGVATPRVKRQLGLEYARAKVAAEARVFSRQRELEGGHARASLSALLRTTANAVPTADSPEEAREAYAIAMKAIADLEAGLHLTPEQAEAARQGFDGDIATALVLRDMNADPAKAVETLSKPGAYGLDEVQRQQRLAQATRMQRQAESAGEASLGAKVNSARRVLVTGGVPDPEELAALSLEVKGTEYEAELAGAVAASERLGGFRSATPKERVAEIEALRAKGVSLEDTSIDAAELRTLEEIHAAVSAAVEKDPVQYAIDTKMPQAAPLDLGDPNSIDARIATVTVLRQWHDAPVRIFTDEERATFEATANEGPPEDQLALVVSMVSNFGPKVADIAFKEMGGLHPVVRMAGDLVLDTGETDVAMTMLAGRAAMQSGDELAAPRPEALEAYEEILDGVLRLEPGRRERVIEGVKAYYAAMAPGRVTQDDAAGQSALVSEAVQKVLGRVEVNGEIYGGIGEVNGMRVKLPSTLNGRAVERMFAAANEETWKAGGLSGNLPQWGVGNASEWTETIPEDAQLQWVRGSIYAVGRTSRRGGFERFRDAGVDSGYFYVDLEAMAEAFLAQDLKKAETLVPKGSAGRSIAPTQQEIDEFRMRRNLGR